MHPKIRAELVSAQASHARAFSRLEVVRENIPVLEQILALGGEHQYWSFWTNLDGVYCGTCFNVESIMFDSPIAAVLDEVENILGVGFTSKVLREFGDIEYRLEKPGFGQVVVTAYLKESGVCRKVVRGYERRTESKTVEVEVAAPIYEVVCGGQQS